MVARMRLFVAIGAALCLLSDLYAEETVKDSQGREIILHDDFTWEYASGAGTGQTDTTVLTKSPNMTAELNSKSGDYTIWYDPTKWQVTTATNEDAEFAFQNLDKTGYAMVILDGLPLTLEQMRDGILMNAKSADASAGIVSSVPAVVNGRSGEILTYKAHIQSFNFTFCTYIATKDSGAIQFTFYTLDSVFDKLKPEFLKAIGGLVF